MEFLVCRAPVGKLDGLYLTLQAAEALAAIGSDQSMTTVRNIHECFLLAHDYPHFPFLHECVYYFVCRPYPSGLLPCSFNNIPASCNYGILIRACSSPHTSKTQAFLSRKPAS